MMYCFVVFGKVFLLCYFLFVYVGDVELYCVDWFFDVVVIWFGDVVNGDGIICMCCVQCVNCYFYYYWFVYCVVVVQCCFVDVDYL